MKKLTSLADLQALLPETAHEEPNTEGALNTAFKAGYDGKVYSLVVKTEKRSGTKLVTIVRGFQSNPDELQDIVASLKKSCGAGGRVLDNEIEIQGDHRTKVVMQLKKLGFRIKE